MVVKCTGTSGHGSLLLADTASEKLHFMMSRFSEFRASQVRRLEQNPNLMIGEVTTVNMTMIEGGYQSNIVPSEMKCVYDVRIALDIDIDEFENTESPNSHEI